MLQLVRRLPKFLLCIGILCLAYGWLEKGDLGSMTEIDQWSIEEPQQTVFHGAAFELPYRGKTYVLEPIADYEIEGLVVTRNDISAFDDIYHDENSVDVVDVCLVWGGNLDAELLGKIAFWSEPWSCNFQTNDGQAFRQFSGDQLSNTHLLPASDSVAHTLRSIRRGDRVRLIGQLVNYYPQGEEWRRRNSSTIRTDTGNGACEVMHVSSANVLSRGTANAYSIWSIGRFLAGAALLLWIFNFVALPLSAYR